MRFGIIFFLVSCASAQITQFAFPSGSSGGSVSYDSTRQVVWYAVESPTAVCKLGLNGSPNTCFSSPSNVATGGLTYSASDDRVYLVEQGVNKIAQFNPNTNTYPNEWTIPDASSGTAWIIPFNGKLYFGETSLNQVNTVSLTGTFGTAIGVGSFPHGATIGLDGKLWFCLNTGNQIGNLDTSNTYTATNLPQASSACGVTAPAVYQGVNQECFTEQGVSKIGCIPVANQATGAITQFSVPTASPNIWGIAQGSDGNLYFGERSANKIGMVTMATGQINDEWTLPNGGTSPNKICLAFSNFIVFTEHVTNNIDVLNVQTVRSGSTVSGTWVGTVK